MTGRYERVFAIFDAAVTRPVHERAGVLDEECRDDPPLRQEVESLLAAHDGAEEFLSSRRIALGADDREPARPSPPVLSPGTRLGAFAIESFIGAGGMGEVYKARDLRLDRYVAIKVISPGAAADPKGRARFTFEARAIARLSHPRICALHDLGHHDGVDFLVMEFLEGETLAARLHRTRLSLGESTQVALEIAEALGAAHAGGIVHRDLKPGNVMLTPAGIKLLDFGLARLRSPVGSELLSGFDRTPSRHTVPGAILGTLPYMAPEQLEGKHVDARADVFAFGAVMYEMVTGRTAAEGDSHASLIAAILTTPPPPIVTHPPTPRALDHLIRKCLEKKPDDRWASMHDLRLQLQWIAQEAMASAVRPTPGLDTRSSRPQWRRALPWASAAILLAASLLALWRWAPWRTTTQPVTKRLSVELGVDGTLAMTDAPVALSPDGTLMAFVARRSNGAPPQLHVRRLDQLTATPIDGTDGATSPFFSPDGQWLAFFAGAHLRKVSVTGGSVVTLADAPTPRGGWWAEDGTIVFAPNNRVGLMRVPATGGQVQPLTTLVGREITHRWPQVLPGGAAVLYTASTEVNIGLDATLVVQPLPSGERTVVQRGGYFGRYAASGHILYVQDDELLAMPFDPSRPRVAGPAARSIDGVRSDSSRGAATFAVSETGTLAYVPGLNVFGARPMSWVDRSGTTAPLRAAAADWSNAAFSPDGQRVAMDIRAALRLPPFYAGEAHGDIWIYAWARDALTRLTFETTNEEMPVWTPDGRRITYRTLASSKDASDVLSWRRADGTGDAQVLIRGAGALVPGSWHPTRPVLVFTATNPGTGADVMMLPVDGDDAHGWTPGKPTALVNSVAREQEPVFSPDGKWLAYDSNESGRDEVYVRPFPSPGAAVMVSIAGGRGASWSHTRPELVFSTDGVDYTGALMVASYAVSSGAFRADKPRPWAEHGVPLRILLGQRTYALHPDGMRVAIPQPSVADLTGEKHVAFVLNFFETLRPAAPTKP